MKINKSVFVFAVLVAIPLMTSCTRTVSVYNPAIQKLSSNAKTFMDKGDFEAASLRLIAINDLNAKLPENHYNLGIAYYNLGLNDESIESLNNAVKLDSGLKDAYYTIAVVYQDLAYADIEKLNDKEEKVEISKDKIAENLAMSIKNFEAYFELADEEEKAEITTKIESLTSELSNYKDIEEEKVSKENEK